MPEENYDEKSSKKLMSMVKSCMEPCLDWPSYPVEIRGRACEFYN